MRWRAARSLTAASNWAGRRMLIRASLLANSNRTRFMSDQSYSPRSASGTKSSPAASLVSSGKPLALLLLILAYLLGVHVARGDRADQPGIVACAQAEGDERRTPRGGPANRPPAPLDCRIEGVGADRRPGGKPAFDLGSRHPVRFAFSGVAVVPIEPVET